MCEMLLPKPQLIIAKAISYIKHNYLVSIPMNACKHSQLQSMRENKRDPYLAWINNYFPRKYKTHKNQL